MTRSFAGLDFGTTNSTLSLCAPGAAPRLLPVEGDNRTIPSALFFSLEDGETYFGRRAVHEYVDGAEGRFMRALKSVLGTSLMRETTLVGRERLGFEEIIGRFLLHLRETLERAADAPGATVDPDTAVFGRPVRFVDESDEADREAENQLRGAALAEGFRHVEFQFEPVAAALYYESTIAAEETAMVVDIGGGTSDVSILRLSPERSRAPDRTADILGTAGVHVGGTDFDRLLNIAATQPLLGMGSETRDGKRRMPNWYFNDLATWHRVNTLYTPKTLADVRELIREAAHPEKLERLEHILLQRSGHRLAGAVERAKIELSGTARTTIRLDEPGLLLEAEATREGFDAVTAELVARIVRAMDATLALAALADERIETVILTGGGAQVPAVREAVARRLPGARLAHSDAFGSVGLGLGLDAARRFA